MPPALVVLADGVQQVAVAQRGATHCAGAAAVVIKGVAQAPCAAVGPGPGGRVQCDVCEAVGACCVSVEVNKLESDPEYTGLVKESVLKPVFTTIEQGLVIRVIGHLSTADIKTLREVVGDVIG